MCVCVYYDVVVVEDQLLSDIRGASRLSGRARWRRRRQAVLAVVHLSPAAAVAAARKAKPRDCLMDPHYVAQSASVEPMPPPPPNTAETKYE